MELVKAAPASWVVRMVNEYGSEPRWAARESGRPYPNLEPFPFAYKPHRQDLIRIADELWPIFSEAEHDRKAALVNDLLSGVSLEPRIDLSGSLAWQTRDSGTLDSLYASVLLTILQSTQILGWDRLGTCNAKDCVDVYLDDTGRAPRKYCSTTCLNRTRIRAFRARNHRASLSS
jgi:hypothetical protein